MKNKLIVFCCLVALAGCTKEESKPNFFEQIGCAVGTTVGSHFSLNLANYLECDDKHCFDPNVVKALVDVGVCKERLVLKSVGSAACEVAGQVVLELASAKIPASCGCKLSVAKGDISKLATKLCGPN